MILAIGVLVGATSYAGDCSSSGESARWGEERGRRPYVHCYCANKGCTTGYTSQGNVILNVVTTDRDGMSRTECVSYDSEEMCLQAMAACN